MTGGRLQARPRLRRRRDVLPDLRRRRRGRRHSARCVAFHRAHGRHATVTAVRPPGRFGALEIDDDAVAALQGEAARATAAGSTAASSCCEPAVLRLHRRRRDASGSSEPLERLAQRRPACWPIRHDGFWQPMDTLRDKNHLEELWAVGQGAVEGVGMNAAFWRGKRVLVTGHTGFKGSWLGALAARARRRGRPASRCARRPTPSLFDLAACRARTSCRLSATSAISPRSRRRSTALGPRSCSTWRRSRSCARPIAIRSRPTPPT